MCKLVSAKMRCLKEYYSLTKVMHDVYKHVINNQILKAAKAGL